MSLDQKEKLKELIKSGQYNYLKKFSQLDLIDWLSDLDEQSHNLSWDHKLAALIFQIKKSLKER